MDRRLSDELGFDLGVPGQRIRRIEDWATSEVRVIGTRQRHVGHSLALSGGVATIGTMLAILATGASPSIQVVLFWLLGGCLTVILLGIVFLVLGMARASRGRKD